MEKTRRFICLCLVFGIAVIKTVSTIGQVNNKKTIFNPSFERKITPLSIGDKVPEFDFTLVNSSTSNGKFSDFKGKYIIIDFWATWCTSCVHHFPKLDSLQKKYKNQLLVLLVNEKNTQDDVKKVSAFFEKRKNGNANKYNLQSIVEDTIMGRLFPHRLIPHYVWIDNTGNVKAITSSDLLTQENIDYFLSNKDLRLPVKRDLNYDYNKPLFVDGNGGSNGNYLYRSFLTGYVSGLPGAGGIIKNEKGMALRLFSTNTSIFSLYRQAFPEINNYPKNRIIFDVKNISHFSGTDDWDTWKYENAYCYELIVPPTSIEKIRKVMQSDLERYFGLRVEKQKRKVDCWILKVSKVNLIKETLNIKTETNIYDGNEGELKYLHNLKLTFLVNYMNSIFAEPTLDESNYAGNVNLENLPSDFKNTKALIESLKKNGIDLVLEQREVEFFVLTEVN